MSVQLSDASGGPPDGSVGRSFAQDGASGGGATAQRRSNHL